MKKRTATVLKWVGIAIIAIGVMYAALLASGKRALKQAYAALEADDRPTTIKQITPPAIPETENAAPLYRAAVLLLKAEPVGERNLFKELVALAEDILEGDADAESEALFRELCQRPDVQEALGLLERGSRKRGCNHDLDYAKGAELLLPHIGEYLNLSRILCARARVRATSGDVQDAWDDLVTSLRFANALHREPIIVSQLVRVAQLSCSTDAIRSVAELGLPNEQQWNEITELLTQFEDPTLYALAIDGERVGFGEWAFNIVATDLPKVVGEGGDINGMMRLLVNALYRPVRAHDHAAYLRVMHAYAMDAEAPYTGDQGVSGKEAVENVPAYCLLTRLCAPALGAIKKRYVSMSADARVTRVGLAALRAMQNGNPPVSLVDLGAGDLVDPCGGKPLVYRATEDGFIVYSLGPDLVDDGGAPLTDHKTGDIVWEYCGGGSSHQLPVISDQ